MADTDSTPVIESMEDSLRRFGIYDYLIFVAMLIASTCIGLFYGLRGRKKNDDDAIAEYLVGNRQMPLFPIAMSLVASLTSGIMLLGSTTEVYLYGIKIMFGSIGAVLSGIIAYFLFLPVFHDMRLSSTYEYLERRFDKRVRILGAVLFTVSMISLLPVEIYVPALTFNQVTGINVHIITPCVCLVCIFYTTLGGLKAVAWTDVLQTILMFGAAMVIAVKATADVGGFDFVWEKGIASERIEIPSFQPDFTDRHSFWSMSFGVCAHLLQTSFMNQNFIQRYVALPTLSLARWALIIFTIGTVFFINITGYTGIVAYATYYGCDPIRTKLEKAEDQLLPLLVMKTLGDYPGVPGFFVAGIFSAALSTLSTGLNAMSAVVLEDFVKPFAKKRMNYRVTSFIMRGTAVGFGVICLALVFLVEKLGTVLQLGISMLAIANGPLLGMFCGGILVPWINSTGTFYGALVGLIVNSVVVFGAQNAKANNQLYVPRKLTSVESCSYAYNITATEMPIPDDGYVFPLFKMSYMFFTGFGGIVTIILAVIISYFTGFTNLKTLDPMYVSPAIRKYLPERDADLEKDEQELIDLLNKDKITIQNHISKNGKKGS